MGQLAVAWVEKARPGQLRFVSFHFISFRFVSFAAAASHFFDFIDSGEEAHGGRRFHEGMMENKEVGGRRTRRPFQLCGWA